MGEAEGANIRGRESMRAKEVVGMDVIAMQRSMLRRPLPLTYQVQHWRQQQTRQGACVKVWIQEPELMP